MEDIAAQLPRLRWLGLDRTPLPELESLPDGFGGAFGGLTTLCLSHTGMQWSQLLFLAAAMPKRVSELDTLLLKRLKETGARLPRENPDYTKK